MRLRAPIALLVALGVAGTVFAQIEGGDRGVAPVDSSGDYEVTDITVDVAGKTADAARLGGWRIAQRKAWAALSKRLGGGGAGVSDGTLDAIVSGIVVQNEQISPTRYIARLGVLFDRTRASALLGIASYSTRSPAMVVLPLQWSGGAGSVFETRTAWQEAWARYRTGNSTIDYIRPTGTGPDALLLNLGQTGRPGRGWWRHVLGQYGGVDVLIPTVRLARQWPGGPVVAEFEARHGPDNRMLGSFKLRVASAAGLPQLLDTGVQRIDDLYQQALRSGYLATDKGLTWTPTAATETEETLPEDTLATESNAAVVTILVQFDSPGAAAVTNTESAVRGVPGVSSATTNSLALGGTSIMSVSYGGPPEAFRQALEARGWQVFGSGTALRIRRAPQLLPPDIQADNTTAG
jgi:hypothetical protein